MLINTNSLSIRRLYQILISPAIFTGVRKFSLSLMGCVLFLCSCSIKQPFSSTTTQNTLSEQVGTLFLRQNQASNKVMLLLLDDSASDKLEQFEQDMLDACKALNEYAVLERDHLKIDLTQKRKIYQTINQCDDKTTQLELLLEAYASPQKARIKDAIH